MGLYNQKVDTIRPNKKIQDKQVIPTRQMTLEKTNNNSINSELSPILCFESKFSMLLDAAALLLHHSVQSSALLLQVGSPV